MSLETQPTVCDGLLRKCMKCIEVRKVLELLNQKLHTWELIGDEPDPKCDPDLTRENVVTTGPWRIRCEVCKDTGLILTDKGRRLLGILSLWLPSAMPCWALISDRQVADDAEIPF
jgi:hypothetical protein